MDLKSTYLKLVFSLLIKNGLRIKNGELIIMKRESGIEMYSVGNAGSV